MTGRIVPAALVGVAFISLVSNVLFAIRSTTHEHNHKRPPLHFQKNQSEMLSDVIVCPADQWPVFIAMPKRDDGAIICVPKP